METYREQGGLSVVMELWFLDQQQHLGVSLNGSPWAPPTWVFTSSLWHSRAHPISSTEEAEVHPPGTTSPTQTRLELTTKVNKGRAPLRRPLLPSDPKITALKKQLCFSLKNRSL